VALGYLAEHPKDCCLGISSASLAPEAALAAVKDRIIAAYPRVFDDTIHPMRGSPYKIPFVPGAKLPPRIVRNIRCPYHREQAAIEEVQTQLREGIISK
jgi:hypothetical protein